MDCDFDLAWQKFSFGHDGLARQVGAKWFLFRALVHKILGLWLEPFTSSACWRYSVLPILSISTSGVQDSPAWEDVRELNCNYMP